jgi:hypothetical protein
LRPLRLCVKKQRIGGSYEPVEETICVHLCDLWASCAGGSVVTRPLCLLVFVFATWRVDDCAST